MTDDEASTSVVQHERWMARALHLAAQGGRHGEVPVGAVIVRDGEILGEGYNRPISGCDPTAHAEVVALRDAAARTGNYRLPGATLYVTIEPCTMCAGALVHARISCVVFGAREPKAGAVVSQASLLAAPYMNSRVSWEEGVLAEQCSALVSGFFAQKRRLNKAPLRPLGSQ
jgi:tRNA(adenine34) deaminase